MEIKIFVLLALLSTKLPTYLTRTTLGYTENGIQCMTNCVPQGDKHFCWVYWGAWGYCKPNPDGRQFLYFTTMERGQKSLCTSMCGRFGEKYDWCFTGEGGSWDYCVKDKNKHCRDCSKHSSGYRCKPGASNIYRDYERCSPDVIVYDIFEQAAKSLKNKVGEFQASTGFKTCPARRFPRQYNEDDVRHGIGVEGIAEAYRTTYNETTFNPPPQSNFPVTSVVTMAVPARLPGATVQIPLAITARLRRANANNTREAIPTFVEQQMIEMDRHRDDERGHLLAASLGGPSHDYNFAPQTTIVNRNYGGHSFWYEVEQAIHATLVEDTTSHVDWQLVVIYGNILVSRRPIGFGIRFREYDFFNHQIHDSGNMFFSNDISGGCSI